MDAASAANAYKAAQNSSYDTGATVVQGSKSSFYGQGTGIDTNGGSGANVLTSDDKGRLRKAFEILENDPMGRKALSTMNKYPIFLHKNWTYKIAFYKDKKMTDKNPEVIDYTTTGYFTEYEAKANGPAFSIDVGASPEEIAATIVHEATHARDYEQYWAARAKDPKTAKLPSPRELEIKAFKTEEQFKIRLKEKGLGVKPLDASFWQEDKGRTIVNEKAIGGWLDKHYRFGANVYSRKYDEKKEFQIGPFRLGRK